MGLIAWYPLNGTGESKGLITNKFSIGASEYGDGGKIGKYYLTSNKIKGTGTISGIENFKQVSIAFWFKENKIETTAWQDFMKFYAYYDDGSKQAGGEFRLEQHTSSDKTQVYADWYCSTTSTSYPSYTGAAVYSNSPQITDLGWHHTVLMLDFVNHKCTSYFDGILNKTMNINTNAKYITGGLYIGDADIDAGICDLRLYDNLLSVQEIKDLNNCLILHYPLNSGYGNENLMRMGELDKNGATSMTYDSSTDTYTIVSPVGTNSWGYGVSIRSTSEISIPYGKSYRGSVEVYVPTQHSFVVDINNNVANGTTAWAGNDNDNTSKRTFTSFTIPANTWKKISWGSENSNGNNTDKVAILPYDKLGLKTNSDTDSVTWYLRHPKIEIGTNVTDWSPNKANNLYSKLGYNSTTVYDTSGFGNNGVMVNNITHTSDTPLYDSSINLQKTNSNYIDLQNTYITNQSTINFWGKVNTFNNWQRFFEFCNVLQGQSGNHRILLATSGNSQQLTLHIYGGDTGTTSLYINNNITTIDTNWHMYSIVFNKTNLKVFMDGTSIVDTTMTQELTSMGRQYSYIGKSSYSGDSYFDGNISDFRIYSTALSAEDIKQLYESRARIDKNGNVYCNQFIDNDCEEELLTSQKMGVSQQNAQAAISYETNGSQIVNIITFEDTLSGWRYLWNSSFDKTKILNNKLRLSFKYKLDSGEPIQGNVAMMKGNGTGSQTISKNTIYFNKQWQEYNGVITFGDTYDSQGIYIAISRTDFTGRTIYIKDLSLKIFNERDNINITKQSQIISSEITELESGKTNINKNNKLIVNEIIEI